MGRTINRLGKYVDIRTDFGMKFYFGREENKILLIAFLNSLFEGAKVIRDLRYAPVEHDDDDPEGRRVIFDLHCIAEDGEHFVVEMQRLYQDHFKDRALFYTSRLISKLLARGKRQKGYRLPEVYFIGILEFRIGGERETVFRNTDRPYFYDVGLCDKHTHELFYDKLGYKLVSLPDFEKTPDNLVTIMDQWLYLLKHLSTMDELPKFLDKRIFGLIFDIGELDKLTKEKMMSYEASLKRKMDAESVYNTATRIGRDEGMAAGLEKGIVQGKEEGMREKAIAIACEFKKMGIPVEDIARGTGLSVEEIEELK